MLHAILQLVKNRYLTRQLCHTREGERHDEGHFMSSGLSGSKFSYLGWNLDNSNCRGSPKSLSYEKFELWVILSLWFGHVATVASPLCSSVFHFLLANLYKIREIFFSYKKKITKLYRLSLLHKNVNASRYRNKGYLMALTTVISSSYDLRFEICPANYHYPGRPMKLGLS